MEPPSLRNSPQLGSSPPPQVTVFFLREDRPVIPNYGTDSKHSASDKILGSVPLFNNYRNPFHDTDGKIEKKLHQHPLEIIFSFFDLKTLLNSRLVNHRWKDVSKLLWGMQVQSVANSFLEIGSALQLDVSQWQNQILHTPPLNIADWPLPFGKKKFDVVEAVHYASNKTAQAVASVSELNPKVKATTNNLAEGWSILSKSIAPFLADVQFKPIQPNISSPLISLFRQIKRALLSNNPSVSNLLNLNPQLRGHLEERAFVFFLSELVQEIALKSENPTQLLPYGSTAQYPSLIHLKGILKGIMKSTYGPAKMIFALSERSGDLKFIDDCDFLPSVLSGMNHLSHLSFFNHDRDNPSPRWGATSHGQGGLHYIAQALSRIPKLTHFCWGALPGFGKDDIEPLLRMIAQREAQPSTTRLEEVVLYDPILQYPEYMPLLKALEEFRGKPVLRVIHSYELQNQFIATVESRCPFIKFDTTRSAFLKERNPWWYPY